MTPGNRKALQEHEYCELRDLRYFETMAKLGHLGRAAEKLGRSQPALTKCIHRLETVFRVKLFERVGRGIRLTEAGGVLRARAQRLRRDTEETIHEVHDYGLGVAGHIRIGSGPMTADYLLPQVCQQLLAQAGNVTIEIVVGWSNILRASLRSGDLDLVVGPVFEDEKEFSSHVLVEDFVVVAASRQHAIFKKKGIRLRDLNRYRWVLPSPSALSRQWLDHAFETAGLCRPQVQIESNSISSHPKLISQTDLLSFISRHHFERSLASGLREVRLKETTMRQLLGVTSRKEGYLAPAAILLVDLLKRMRLLEGKLCS